MFASLHKGDDLMIKCDICGSIDEIAMIYIGQDGYGQFSGKPTGEETFVTCLWCREQIILNINQFKENNSYVHSNS